jgi:hypothetical protein
VLSGDPVVVIIETNGRYVKAITPVGIGYGTWDGYGNAVIRSAESMIPITYRCYGRAATGREFGHCE